MKFSAALVAAAATAASAKLEPITMKGTKLFYTNGTQFFMKGVAYQQDIAAGGQTNDKTTTYQDPLADEDACKRDVPLLKELGTNIIRTYAINPKADHKACMKLLDDAGIYVISDLSEPSVSINRDDPKWDIELYQRYIGVVDELAQYDNVVGFFAGNEVSNNVSNTQASAFVKAAVRDTKAHIKSKYDRWLGVGYASNDDVDIREEIADYFNCGDDSERIDYWGYNIYSWCGKSNMEDSGYSNQAKFFKDYSVPVFFAEYGCNEPGGAAARTFDETTVLYEEKEMVDVFSGGIVYMYFQEANDYGLVKVSKNDAAVKLKDFDQLKSKATSAHATGVDKDDYKPTGKAATCPEQSKSWKVASNALPPTPDSKLCDCMKESRSCVPADNLKAKDFDSIFGYICGENKKICTAINGNATTGVYGAYSMCDNDAKLAYILDAYYNDQKKAADACDFKGLATTQKAKSEDTCKSALESASQINDKVATATAAVGASSTGASGDSEEDDKSFGLQAASIARVFSLGDYAVGAYMAVAGAVGAGMVLL
ncbi:putative beta (1-3) glucanosyltransferase gel3p [Fusarium heterosporum]|uniref:1,3-beta-glucanosyltransferase n=1 Tax=Fusarium heterosporum TaxID=42747 RepID=A0A8H5T616_FUSHE|nr:putative beta (1-3) glucanosyltransferase gel3p [Fusarium heterosporum]